MPLSSHSLPDTHDQMVKRLRVVITGGSAGIGAAIVRTFAAAGHHVFFTFLHSTAFAAAIARETRATTTQLDQGDVASVAHFAGTVADWAGDAGVDVLVNNAALGSATVGRYVAAARDGEARVEAAAASGDGLEKGNGYGVGNGVGNGVGSRVGNRVGNGNGNRSGAVKSMSRALPKTLQNAAEDEALMRVNSLGPLWVTEALMPLVEKAASGRRGRASVIFIGSVGGGSAAVFPEYRASDLMGKAAMTYLAKHLAAKHVRSPVDIMCLSPGATETDMFRQSTLSRMADADAFIDNMPKRRLIQPDDLAETVLWLAVEPAARVFHGAVLDASMGLAVRPGLQTEQSNR